MNLALLSLIALIAAIVVGFYKKINIGILSIGVALVMGRIAGISDKAIIKGFDASLFMTLLGVTFLFSIINENKALLIGAKKIVRLIGKRTWLLPILMYAIGYAICAAGPGAIPSLALMPAFAIPLAKEMGFDPLMLCLIADCGVFSGRMNSITPEGVLITGILEKQKISGFMLHLNIGMTVTAIILSIIIYVYYKGYRVIASKNVDKNSTVKFSKQQVVSLFGLLAMVIMVMFFKFNPGLAAFLIGIILLMLGVADERKSIKGIPWGVLLLVTGVGVLMQISISLGGIKLLSHALASIMNKYTAGAIMGVTAGTMSWFVSGLGVVFPTLMPTVGGIAHLVGNGVSINELVSAIGIAATITVGPTTTTGSLIMATIMTEGGSKGEENKIFIRLWAWTLVALALVSILAILGVYRIL
ncbi:MULTISPECIES: SLC13 family permease [Clostridium]|uniref:SLC13 family permease n=1 Tax=Clostridium lapidicellarium TaxID=3240931 RepID=A0ABV4DYJ4_9CLOT|nr:C4-dicarboxylate ABC transporter [Clostridiales bacterium]